MSLSKLISRSKVSTKPLISPISLDDLKAQIRRDDPTYTIDDDILQLYIDAATEQAQDYTGRKFIDQEITLFYDSFPSSSYREEWWSGVRRGTEAQFRKKNADFLDLPWAPCASITEISTFADDDTETVYDASNYSLDNYDDDRFSRVVFNLNASYVTNLRAKNGIKIVYKVGYGLLVDDVPADLRVGVSMIGAYLYMNRGDCDGSSGSVGKMFLDNKVILGIS